MKPLAKGAALIAVGLVLGYLATRTLQAWQASKLKPTITPGP